MIRITHNLLILAALTSASLSLVAGTKRVRDDGFMRDGDDWNLMEEWFIDDKRWRKDGKRDVWQTIDARSEGTFWNVRKAKGFVNQPPPVNRHLVEDGDDWKVCGVVFYYPAFWLRENEGRPQSSQGNNKISDKKTREAFEKPLAISTWCDPEPKEDWGNKDKKIVFHNYYWETDVTENDMYLILTYDLDSDPDMDVKDKRGTLSLADFWKKDMWYATASNSSDIPDSFNTKADLEYIYDLLGSHTNGTHNGQVPNPYKYGIDSRLWSEWSGVERFWGYVWNNSTRLLMPTEGYPDCPDKDDLSLC